MAETRKERGISQCDLAARLGRPQSFVSKFESGERRLDVVEFLEVCQALGTSAVAIVQRLEQETGLGADGE